MMDSPILVLNVPNGGSRLGLYSSDDEGYLMMNKVYVRVTSLDRAKINLGLVLSKITWRETSCTIQSLKKSDQFRCYISTNQNSSFYDTKMRVVQPGELMEPNDAGDYP